MLRNLDIQNGLQAANDFERILSGLVKADEVRSLRHALLRYCERDTEVVPFRIVE